MPPVASKSNVLQMLHSGLGQRMRPPQAPPPSPFASLLEEPVRTTVIRRSDTPPTAEPNEAPIPEPEPESEMKGIEAVAPATDTVPSPAEAGVAALISPPVPDPSPGIVDHPWEAAPAPNGATEETLAAAVPQPASVSDAGLAGTTPPQAMVPAAITPETAAPEPSGPGTGAPEAIVPGAQPMAAPSAPGSAQAQQPTSSTEAAASVAPQSQPANSSTAALAPGAVPTSAAEFQPADESPAPETHPHEQNQTDQLPSGSAEAPTGRERPQSPVSEFVHGARPDHDLGQFMQLHGGREFGQSVAAAAHAVHDAAAAPSAPVPLEGLAIEIAAQAQAGRHRFEIRLDPPELGRIDVRLDIDRNGQITSRLMVERAETLDVLRRDAHQLERALQDAGLKTSEGGLQFSMRDQAFAERNNDGGDDARHGHIADAEQQQAGATVSTYGLLLRGGSGVDIRV